MASRELEGFGQKLGGLGKLGGLATAALATVATAGVGLAVGLGAAVGKASDFQQSIANVASLLGGDMASNTSALSALALQLGNDITLSGVGATDAAAAMKELAAAGFTVKEMSDGVTLGVLRLASATGTDVARAAEIAGDTFNTFRKAMGLTAADMPGIADLFTGVANASSVGLEDIGASMKMIGPVAAAMGIDMNEVAVAIAALGNQGIKGSEAGTALRGVLASLADPSKESAKLIKTLGLNFRDSEGQLKNFGGIADELNGKLAGLTQAQREQAIVQLFGRENLAAVLALMSEGSAGLDEYGKAIAAQGNAAAIGAARNNTFKGAMQTLGGVVETAAIAFGTGMLPALQAFAQRMATSASSMLPFITMLGQKLGAALTVAIGLFQRFASYVGSAIAAVVDAFQKLRGGQITLAQFIGGIKQLIGTLAGDLFGGAGGAGIGNFVGTIVGALRQAMPVIVNELAILGRAFGDWVTTTALPWLMPKLGALLTAIGGWITGTALPWIGNALLVLGQAFGNWVTTTAVPFLQANLPIWLSALGTWISGTALPWIGTQMQALGQAFGNWITTTAIPFLQANLPVWLAALGTWITGTALPAIGAFLGMVGEKFGTWISETAIPYLQTNIPLWLAALGDWIMNTAAPAVGEFLVVVGQAMGDWITNTAVPWLQEKLPEWGKALSDWILNDGLPQAVTALSSLGEKFGNWITDDAIPAVQAKLPEWSSAVADFIQNTAIPAITAKATELGAKLLQAVLDAIKDAPSKIGDIFDKVKTALTSPLADAAREAATKMATFASAITTALAGLAVTAAVGAIKIGLAIVTGILGALTGLAGKLYTAGANAVQGLIDGMGSLLGAVKQKAGEIAKAAADAITGLWKEHSPSRLTHEYGVNFVQGLVNGMDEKQQEAAKKAAEVASAVAKAVTDTLGAMRAISGFDFGKNTPSGEQLGWLRDTTKALIASISEAAADWEKEGLEKVSQFADTAQKVGGSITSTLTGLAALARFDFANDSPSGSAMAWFTHLASSLVENFADAAQYFEQEALDAASAFADAAGKVGGSVSNALKGLQELAKADWAESSPSGSAMGWFTHLIGALIQNFADAAATFAEGTLDAASDFADTAGKVGGAVGNAVKGLKDLASADWAESSPSGSAMAWFTFLIESLARNFAEAASHFDTGVLDAANRFAETAGKVAGVIGPAVAGFRDLATAVAPSPAAMDQLAAGIEYIVRKFGDMATMLDAEGTKHVQDFAAAAGTVVNTAKSATDLFKAFAADKDGKNGLVIPSAAALDQLAEGIKYVVYKFRDMATMLEAEGVKAVADFAAGVSTIVNSAKGAVDLFKGMEKLEIPAKEVIDYLLGSIGYVVTQTRAIANGIGEEGMAQAQAFATGVLTFVGSLKASFELFKELDSFKDIPATMLEQLHKSLEDVLDWGQKIWEQSEALKAVALDFANNMKEAARAFAEGQSLGNGLPSGSALLTAPAGLGGGGFDSQRASGTGGNTYNVNFSGPTYGVSDMVDVVVGAMQTATRTGRG